MLGAAVNRRSHRKVTGGRPAGNEMGYQEDDRRRFGTDPRIDYFATRQYSPELSPESPFKRSLHRVERAW
jgi:hypothetical protein